LLSGEAAADDQSTNCTKEAFIQNLALPKDLKINRRERKRTTETKHSKIHQVNKPYMYKK